MGAQNRRILLLGGLALLGSACAASAAALAPTPRNELGPFYKMDAPHDAVLAHDGDRGMPLNILGGVFRSTGEAVPGARVEVWQADDEGLYDVASQRNGILYLGYTDVIYRHVTEHKAQSLGGFTENFNVERLVW